MLPRNCRRLLLVISLASVAACRTTTESETKEASQKKEIRIPEAPPPLTAPECPPADIVCTQEFSPVLCTTSSVGSRTLADDERILAWGNNLCFGHVALKKEACRENLVPSDLGKVECVPDGSSGNCPAESVACPPSEAPSVCTANAYGDKDWSKDQALKAWGSNACAANANLLAAACRRNLNPKALKKIVCTDDPTAGECPPPVVVCNDKPHKARCTARKYDGNILKEPIEIKDENACEAKQGLARLACKRSLKPSAIDEIVCVFEK